MPRHLEHALDLVERRGGLGCYSHAWGSWTWLGMEVPVATRRRVRALWSSRPDLRGELAPLVRGYPCDELERPFCKLVEREVGGDFAAWLRWAPRLRTTLAPWVIAAARRFNHADDAIYAATIWARHFDGGDEAYRAIALALNRHDRVRARLPACEERDARFLRDRVGMGGDLSREEASAVNCHLAELGAETLFDGFVPERGWWKTIDMTSTGQSAWVLALDFGRIVEAVHAFAGDRWDESDTAEYARAWLRLPRYERSIPPPPASGSAYEAIVQYAASVAP